MKSPDPWCILPHGSNKTVLYWVIKTLWDKLSSLFWFFLCLNVLFYNSLFKIWHLLIVCNLLIWQHWWRSKINRLSKIIYRCMIYRKTKQQINHWDWWKMHIWCNHIMLQIEQVLKCILMSIMMLVICRHI